MTALRAYEPLEAFAPSERSALAALAADPSAGVDAEEAERAASWRRVLGWSAALPPEPSGRPPGDRPGSPAGQQPSGPVAGVRTDGLVHARVLRAQGAVLLAPVVVEPVAESERRHTLVRAWEIPSAWLTLVRAEDLTRSGGRGRYVLPISRARARAARALRALRSAVGDADVTLDVEVLARWLEQFHPRSWVELDARAVAALVDGEDGAEDVRLGLECLAAGDATGLAAAYQRVSRRSHRLEQLSVSS